MSKEDLKIFKPNEYKVRCNLCDKEMYIYQYNTHYDRCLMIKTLIPMLKEKGEDVDYEILSKYDTKTLEKVLYKYLPIKENLKEIIKNN